MVQPGAKPFLPRLILDFMAEILFSRYLNVEQGYFECPLCKRASNCVVPRNSIKEKTFVPLPTCDIAAFPSTPINGLNDLDAEMLALVTNPGAMKVREVSVLSCVSLVREPALPSFQTVFFREGC